MKKTGILLLLAAGLACAQTSPMSTMVAQPDASGIVPTSVSVPFVRYQTPTASDIYCAGFLAKNRVPDANFVTGGLETPTSTKFEYPELIYLRGTGYQVGQLYSIVRELRDINEYEIYPGMRKLLAAAGHPYSEVGRVRVVDMRSKEAIAQVEFSCDAINPGDVAVPFVQRDPVTFHVPGHFDRFAPSSGKLTGRIVLAKDFDLLLGTGTTVYLNVGSNQGVKPGDYFRVVRSYMATLQNPVDSLTFKAQTSEDTQMRPPTIEANFLTKGKGPNIHIGDLPKRAVGEVVVLSTTPTSSAAMLVFSFEDVYAGDNVELDHQD
ncbi:MAG TPA: hypothetical protein VL983_11020 [Terriglobales bacterium]|nr:hypothetical protein [Terriglobales bacterium]